MSVKSSSEKRISKELVNLQKEPPPGCAATLKVLFNLQLLQVSRQLSELFCQRGQLSEGTTVSGDNCQRGQLSEDQLSEETVRAFLALGQL